MPKKSVSKGDRAKSYRHPQADSPMRPEIGTQAQFKKKKAPKTYRYDSSLSPALDWDGQNPVREQGEALIHKLQQAKSLDEVKAASHQLRVLSKPFLNWAGKAERLSFDVPTLPMFVHERLSTKAIIETLKGHRRDKQANLFDLFGDPQHSITDQVLRAYEHRDKWVNRMILGDALVVMNSLLEYEGLGGEVQMIYIDPPYGVRFGSNFQPFVRKRDVQHGADEDMTREPEMVKAYRDTWELGLHSYLTYMRDRLLLSRELLAPSGSVFVQISDENVHHVRELVDETFGAENFVAVISFNKGAGLGSNLLPAVNDYLLWYARSREQLRYRQIFRSKNAAMGGGRYTQLMLSDGTTRPATADEITGLCDIPEGARLFMHDNLTKPGPGSRYALTLSGRTYRPEPRWWGTTPEGMQRLIEAGRVAVTGNSLSYVRYLDDFPAFPLTNSWTDVAGIMSRSDPKIYVVQTSTLAIQRCILMTTDPGDLVLDPTCGSGTTAYVAEQWGRRWITIDTSRVPLALARQRLLTATYPYYQLKDEKRGPAGGFVYGRKQNKKNEEVGGIIPHVTLKSIANNEPPEQEVLVDRPAVDGKIVRVAGPFAVEAMIPTPVDWEGDGVEDSGAQAESRETFVDRMLTVLRRSPVLRLEGNRTVELKNVRLPAKTLSLSAEALVGMNGSQQPVALVFGPGNGAISETLVYAAAREGAAKGYKHLYVIGFAVQPNARVLIENCDEVIGIPATYVQATPDLLMGDLLKNMRSSEIFSVCGLPEIKVKKAADGLCQVELLGLDVFEPTTMEVVHREGGDVPAWLLDTDYNGLVFHVSQAFFPRTGAWDSLKKALKMEFEESVWDHLAGTTSAPFETGDHRKVAVKVIDDRGNELLVVQDLAKGKR